MIPYIVTAPSSLPVSEPDMKEHLRVDHSDEDAVIAALQAGAVAKLDAFGGLLGRCIMPQTWAIDVTGAGPHLLPFPDATEVAAEAGGEPLATTVSRTPFGVCVTVSDAVSGDTVTIRFLCGLSDERLPAAQTLVKLMVERDFDGLSGADYDAITRQIDSLISALRWWRL